ncbi:MAG: hypothetical protein FD123_4066 [Bacteroidetes bacterium]|nr:MAG: hypothetical protein FD123_4066 [Bacteroidota bacterium]
MLPRKTNPMRKRFIITSICLAFAVAVKAQILTPTKTEALVVLIVANSEGKPVREEMVRLESETTGLTYSGFTNMNGVVELLAPAGDNYRLHFTAVMNFARLVLPNEKFYTYRNKIMYDGKAVLPDNSIVMKADTTFFYGDSVQNMKPTYSIVLLHFTLTDYHGHALDSEVVQLRGMKSRKYFTGITGKNGQVFILLPKGDQYELNFAFEKNIDRLDYPIEAGFRRAEVTYSYEGSRAARVRLALEKERLEKERLAQIEFNKDEFRLWSKQIDYYASLPKPKIDSTGTHGRPKDDSLRMDSLRLRGADPVVSDVLVRNFYWNTQLFVTDLTGSMSPYTQQLAQWFKEKVKINPDLALVFFNDGDGKPDKDKIPGNTGGLHYCLKCNEQQLEKTVKETMAGGTGGDAPENNIEALIKSIERTKPNQPVVMIADNKAPVKDIVLLDQVKNPLRIILCGVTGPIHPDYIKMAYATKGSLHTLKEDIYKLPELSEGRIITIAGFKYAYSRGNFIVMK